MDDSANVEMLMGMMNVDVAYTVLRRLCQCFTLTVPYLQAAHQQHKKPCEAIYAHAQQFEMNNLQGDVIFLLLESHLQARMQRHVRRRAAAQERVCRCVPMQERMWRCPRVHLRVSR